MTERRPSSPIRPRDRRLQIVALAADMFWQQGFDGVSILDLSNALGITSGALYRHFPSKDELLAEPIRNLVRSWYGGALIAVDRSADPHEALDGLIDSAVLSAIDHPSAVGLWYRERRHVPQPQFGEIREMRRRTYGVWQGVIHQYRPELTASEIDFRLATAHGILYCLPLIDVRIGRESLTRHLVAMMKSQIDAPRHGLGTAPQGPTSDGAPRNAPDRQNEDSRSEQILAAGAALFRQYGYHRVSIDQIGEAVGLQGPSVYTHFDSKSDVLKQLMLRIAEQLQSLLGVPDATQGPLDKLTAILDRYIDLALRESDLIAVYATELQHLPTSAYALTQRKRKARAKVLCRLVSEARPELGRAEATVVLLATLEALFALVRDPELSALPQARAELLGLAMAAITA